MNRQLLSRRQAEAPDAGRTVPSEVPAARRVVPAVRRPAGGDGVRVLRRPAVLSLLAVAAVVLAGVGWTLLNGSPDPAAGSAPSVLLRPRTPAPSVDTAPRTSTADEVPTTGRDPFGDTGTATGGPAPVPTSATGTTPEPARPPADRTGTPSTSASALPTSRPTSPPATSTAPDAEPSPSASGAPAVTVTVTTEATYVGLYAWNGSRASFRVNARTWSVPVGTAFGPGLRFTAVVPGVKRCARLTHGASTFTLCPGQVVPLP